MEQVETVLTWRRCWPSIGLTWSCLVVRAVTTKTNSFCTHITESFVSCCIHEVIFLKMFMGPGGEWAPKNARDTLFSNLVRRLAVSTIILQTIKLWIDVSWVSSSTWFGLCNFFPWATASFARWFPPIRWRWRFPLIVFVIVARLVRADRTGIYQVFSWSNQLEVLGFVKWAIMFMSDSPNGRFKVVVIREPGSCRELVNLSSGWLINVVITEDDPVQRIVETRGRRSKMTQQGLFANQYRTKLFKAMHESTCQEDLQNKTYQRNRSCAKTHHWMSTMHENTDKRDVQYESYQEEGSSAKNVMRNTLHHPRDCQN